MKKDTRQETLKKMYISEYLNIFPKTSDSYLKWLESNTSRIIGLRSGELIKIEKPRIKTDFCFGYGSNGVSTQEEYCEAEERADHARTAESYFIAKNLEDLIWLPNQIKKYLDCVLNPSYYGSQPLTPYLIDQYVNNNCKIKAIVFKNNYWDSYFLNNTNHRELALDELQEILNEYDKAIEDFKKRLQTYLKRYGLTKIHAWSYLSD